MAKNKKRNNHNKPKQAHTPATNNTQHEYLIESDIPITVIDIPTPHELMIRRDKIHGNRAIPPILIPDSIYTNQLYANGQPMNPAIISKDILIKMLPRRKQDYTRVKAELPRLVIDYMRAFSASVPHMSEAQLCKLNLIDVEQFKHADGRSNNKHPGAYLPTDHPCVIPALLEGEDYNTELLPDIKQYVNRNGFWAYVPCFKEGAIRANKGRYFYYKVNNIDADNKVMSIFLKTYYKYEDIWVPSLHADLDVTWSKDNKTIYIYHTQGELMDIEEWMNLIDPNTIEWTVDEHSIWNFLSSLCKIEAEKQKLRFAKINGGHCELGNMMQISFLFFAIIAGINQMLSTQKEKITLPRNHNITTKPLDKNHTYESIIRNRTIRHIGPINIISKTTPTLPSERSAANYTMQSWKQRGHVRTYKKTGKQIWVKEMNKVRHVLRDKSTAPTPNVTINVHTDPNHPFGKESMKNND